MGYRLVYQGSLIYQRKKLNQKRKVGVNFSTQEK
jgi:hypothetical protein